MSLQRSEFDRALAQTSFPFQTCYVLIMIPPDDQFPEAALVPAEEKTSILMGDVMPLGTPAPMQDTRMRLARLSHRREFNKYPMIFDTSRSRSPSGQTVTPVKSKQTQ